MGLKVDFYLSHSILSAHYPDKDERRRVGSSLHYSTYKHNFVYMGLKWIITYTDLCIWDWRLIFSPLTFTQYPECTLSRQGWEAEDGLLTQHLGRRSQEHPAKEKVSQLLILFMTLFKGIAQFGLLRAVSKCSLTVCVAHFAEVLQSTVDPRVKKKCGNNQKNYLTVSWLQLIT